MARLTAHLCAEPYCDQIVDGPGRCPEHRRTGWQARPPATPPGAYGPEWRRARDRYIKAHPRCEHAGCTAPAREVHHVNHDPLDNREENWRALCLEHHRRETVAASHRSRRSKSSSSSST